jgi:4-diphosphocytidyl-2-C-methyl-D-erythritol kinase
MPVSEKQLTVLAPAKINLHLAVKERRADGFHNLESIFLKVDFGDILHFFPINDKDSIKISMKFVENADSTGNRSLINIPQENNLIFKAVSLFRSKTGFDQGLIIKVEKRIPAESGLGGGSSDAAATLLVLNKMAGFPLNLGEFLEIAAVLGSDVPFFIHETGAAWVTGRGACIKPLETPRWFLTLAVPGFPSATTTAFRLLDNYRQASSAFIREVPTNMEDTAPSRLCGTDFAYMYNDFLPVFPGHEKSVYNGIIAQLKELGAVFASLSGSGSACFGVFNEKTYADNASVVLGKKWKLVKSCTAG